MKQMGVTSQQQKAPTIGNENYTLKLVAARTLILLDIRPITIQGAHLQVSRDTRHRLIPRKSRLKMLVHNRNMAKAAADATRGPTHTVKRVSPCRRSGKRADNTRRFDKSHLN